uniref:Uncharacterized protein n=1 Tax=Plectus sambesii TaxID=2011161 RepID=A0A914X8T6_9BILA
MRYGESVASFYERVSTDEDDGDGGGCGRLAERGSARSDLREGERGVDQTHVCLRERRPATVCLLWAAVAVGSASDALACDLARPRFGSQFYKADPWYENRPDGGDGRPIDSVAAAARETSSAVRRSFLRLLSDSVTGAAERGVQDDRRAAAFLEGGVRARPLRTVRQRWRARQRPRNVCCRQRPASAATPSSCSCRGCVHSVAPRPDSLTELRASRD